MPERRSNGDRDQRAERIGSAAARAIDETVRAGAEAYDRLRDLPKLARIDIGICVADNAESAAAIVARLQSALRAERNRARSGHWTYDLNRHIALAQAYRAESGRLAALRAERR
jgi:hypothetical protein